MYSPSTIPSFYLLLALLCLHFSHAAAAVDLNDILMLKSPECNNYGDQMACTDVAADFCCSAVSPFCYVAVYNKARIPGLTLSAWANTNTCNTNAPAPIYCTHDCGCLDALTPGADDAQCAALWSTTRGEESRGCRVADTLRYLDPNGTRLEIRGIVEANFKEIVGHYVAGEYAELAPMAVRSMGEVE